jgi:uncharacterized protein (DUF4415 family)
MPPPDADDMQEEYDFSQGRPGPAIPHSGKTRITIWVDTDVLDWFRAQAEREGRGYQAAMNVALRQYTQQDEPPLPELLRTIIREELHALKAVSSVTQR